MGASESKFKFSTHKNIVSRNLRTQNHQWISIAKDAAETGINMSVSCETMNN